MYLGTWLMACDDHKLNSAQAVTAGALDHGKLERVGMEMQNLQKRSNHCMHVKLLLSGHFLSTTSLQGLPLYKVHSLVRYKGILNDHIAVYYSGQFHLHGPILNDLGMP